MINCIEYSEIHPLKELSVTRSLYSISIAYTPTKSISMSKINSQLPPPSTSTRKACSFVGTSIQNSTQKYESYMSSDIQKYALE